LLESKFIKIGNGKSKDKGSSARPQSKMASSAKSEPTKNAPPKQTDLKVKTKEPKNVLKKRVSLTRQQTDKLHLVFDMFDENKDGTIDRNNVENVLKKFSSTGALSPGVDINLMVEQFKSEDSSGTSTPRVGFTDFKKTMKRSVSNQLGDDFYLNESFGLFDTDQDGFISLKELQANLPKFDSDFSEKEIERIFDLADANKDGKIDKHEYITLMNSLV